MAERDNVIREKHDYSGLVDFSGFYSFCWGWFKNELYGVDEIKYAEKVSGNSRDIDIEWRATKPISDYFKIDFRLVFEIRELSDVEVEVEGKKKNMNKGKISVEIRGALVRDPDSKMDRSPVLKFFREIYSKYVIPGRIEDMKLKVSGDAQTFNEEMKAYLDLIGRR